MSEDLYFRAEKGTKREIAEHMASEFNLTQEQAEACVGFLVENMEAPSEEETIYIDADSSEEEAMSGFMTDSMTYYVSLKVLTVYLISFLLGCVTGNTVLQALSGVAVERIMWKPVIVWLGDCPEGKCMTLEFSKYRRNGVSLHSVKEIYGISKRRKAECFNNHYPCPLRREGFCTLQEERLNEIISYLERNGVIKRNRWGKYCYQW